MNQVQKSLLSLVVLVVVAAGAAFFAYKSIYEPDDRAAKKKSFEERLIAVEETKGDAGVNPFNFSRLTVVTKGESTTLERGEDRQWQITSPVRAKTDPLVIDSLVSQLQSARFKTTLEGEATDAELKSYGLDAPAFSVEAEGEMGGKPFHLKLEGGFENPFDGSIYMRRDNSRVVSMAEGGVRWSLAKSTFDLRQKEVLAIDEAKVTRFSVKSKMNDWEVVRGDDKLWRLTRPEAVLADTTTVTSVLAGLRGERAVSFPGEPTTERLKSLGLDVPQVTATFVTEHGTVTIKLAVPRSDAGNVAYALREDEKERILAEVTTDARNAIDRNSIELKDKSLMPFAKQSVTHLTLSAPGSAEVVLERDPQSTSLDAWHVTSPKSGQAKAYKVASALWTLAGLKVGTVVAPKADPRKLEQYGLDAKRGRSITLKNQSGEELAKLVLGSEVMNKTGSIYALAPSQAIVETEASNFKELPWNVDDILASIDPDAGTSVEQR